MQDGSLVHPLSLVPPQALDPARLPKAWASSFLRPSPPLQLRFEALAKDELLALLFLLTTGLAWQDFVKTLR